MKSLFCFLLLFVFTVSVFASVSFKADFAPDSGVINDIEKPYKADICLNGAWDFQGGVSYDYTLDKNAWSKIKISIPSPWNVNSFSAGDGGDFISYPSYPKDWDSYGTGIMRKTFDIPKLWDGKRVYVEFSAIAGGFEVFVNGKAAGSGFDSFMPFKFDITNFVNIGGSNEIIVKVKKPAFYNRDSAYGSLTYPSGSFWGMHIGGIWQDVFVYAVPEVSVSDIYIVPDVFGKKVTVTAEITNLSNRDMAASLDGDIYNWVIGKNGVAIPQSRGYADISKSAANISGEVLNIPAGGKSTIKLIADASQLTCWTMDKPKLYFAVIKMRDSAGKVIDIASDRFGYRDFKISGNQILLNGKPVVLKSDSWHFMGIAQMTRRYPYAWFKTLKSANGNAVRLHAQPFPEFYLDMADEMGIAVLDESAIWASHCAFNYNEPETWDRFYSHEEKLVLRDRNHASVFGWSIENEITAALAVTGQKEDVRNVVIKKAQKLADIVRRLDPSRDFISGDGCEDLGGYLPVNMLHYGDASYFKRIADKGKPWGVGEASSAYYATPKELSRWNGNRAYESSQGRMEALAYESYDLLANGQRVNGANYMSVFNMAWYSLQPLPLGLDSVSRASTLEDGIFFEKQREGQIGVQPERLGPYVTTFNPGYDPKLPLYKPWDMFYAIRDAYAPEAPVKGKWSEKPVIKLLPDFPKASIKNVYYIGDKTSELYTSLSYSGWNVTNDTASKLLVVDGALVSDSNYNTIKKAVDFVTSRGGTAVIWGFAKNNIETVNKLLPYKAVFTDRKASSLVSDVFNNSDIYFTESASNPYIMKYGIDGDIIKNGKIILSACNADWSRWNFKGENVKTAAIVRSERETKPSGVAMVQIQSGKGNIVLTSLDGQISNKERQAFYQKLASYFGVEIVPLEEDPNAVCNMFGNITKAMVSPMFGAKNYADALNQDYINPNDAQVSQNWKELKVAGDGMFDFAGLAENDSVSGAVYLSFWLHSPQPLNELLANPNVPKVSFYGGSDDGMRLWVNGDLLCSDDLVHPCIPDSLKTGPIAFKKGWNHVVVKVIQGSGRWQFVGRFVSTDPDFWKTVTFSLNKPGDK